MNMKPVELQFAIHKNDEAGLKQNQLMHKPVHDQAALAGEAGRETEKERRTAAGTEASKRADIRDDEGQPDRRGSGGRSGGRRSGGGEDPGSSGADGHPYKGRHIDLLL